MGTPVWEEGDHEGELGVLKGAFPPLGVEPWAGSAKMRVVVCSEWGVSSPAGRWWRSAWQPVSTSSLRSHPCESEESGLT